jgi:hypothetical protein
LNQKQIIRSSERFEHSTKEKSSVALALIRAIENSKIQIAKNVRATGFGTILLTIMVVVQVGSCLIEPRFPAAHGASVACERLCT